MDWFGSDLWVTWIAVGVVCLGVEMLSGALVFLMFGVAGFCAALAAVVGGPEPAQVAVFASMAIALLSFVRPRIMGIVHNGPTIAVGAHRLIGQTAVVVDDVVSGVGRIRIGDQLWSARPADSGDTFHTGDEVLIAGIEGATAVVARKDN